MQKLILALVTLCASTLCLAQPLQQEQKHPRASEAAQVSSAWLEQLEAGKFTESFEQLTDIFKGNLTKEVWLAQNTKSQLELGPLKSRKLRRVVMYENPKNAPLPGTYAAVEYDSVYQHATKHFQYVMLHSQRGEPFKVMRRESTFALDHPPGGANAR